MTPDAISVRGVRDTIDYIVGLGYTVLALVSIPLVVMGGLDPHTAFTTLAVALAGILVAHAFLSYHAMHAQDGETTGLPATQND